MELLQKSLETPIEILIVEDSRTQAAYLSHILEQHSYKVFVARHGGEALDFLSGHIPTLIISDIDMPGMTGYELCSRIKNMFAAENLPVILLTSLSDPKDVIKALECGADNFITKPFDEGYLLARIAQILDKRNVELDAERESPDDAIKVMYEGQPYRISASRQQMLDLLLSTYETAVHKNLELLDQLAKVRELSNQLAEAATHDELTGLYNYGFFIHRLAEEIDRSHRYHRPLALLMGDVDHFKQVNDRYGHQVGNIVLQSVAEIFASDVRNTDIAARYGGEEFALILPETTGDEARVVAEHIRIAIEEKRVPGAPDVTISLGISEYQELDSSSASLIKRADRALYQAKKDGRNRVTLDTEVVAS